MVLKGTYLGATFKALSTGFYYLKFLPSTFRGVKNTVILYIPFELT
jgi:hypothetical protein